MANVAAETTCCVVGGGPAGIMLGYLLARKGVTVKVLEKHKDFFRDSVQNTFLRRDPGLFASGSV